MSTSTRWLARIARAPSMRVVHIMELPRAVATAWESADAPAQRSVFPQQSK
jgi:hypothetical protein